MNEKKNILFSIQPFAFLTLFLILTFSVTSRNVHSASTQNIDATVQIGVCGNGSAEDNEDCEGTNLKGETCISLGYGGGTLSCDTSCTLNTSLCTSVNEDKHSDTNKSKPRTETKTVTQVITNIIYKYELPDFIKVFDTNGDNKIDASELYGLSKKWVDAWKVFLVQQVEALKEEGPEVLGVSTCDLNKDKECNLIDFSVLMYYVDRK
jgi:hypothetical protein